MTILPDHTTAPDAEPFEDASVYGSGVILHPLPGHPRLENIAAGPAGPIARFRDGDLVLRIDRAAIDAWAAELARAQQQMTDSESETQA